MSADQRIIGLLFLLLMQATSCVSTLVVPPSGSIRVDARQWSKVEGVVHYSDWKPCYATTMGRLKGFTPVTKVPETKYGSDPEKKFRATGFFYTHKEDGRWWIIDPNGHATWNIGVNGVRPGSSSRNEQSLREKFVSEENWITRTHSDLEDIGFNGTACWSEVPLVRYSNKHCPTPLSYTLILSFYAGYQKQVKYFRRRVEIENPGGSWIIL